MGSGETKNDLRKTGAIRRQAVVAFLFAQENCREHSKRCPRDERCCSRHRGATQGVENGAARLLLPSLRKTGQGRG
jgi:hypothetical protein